MTDMHTTNALSLATGLVSDEPSQRLQAALWAGIHPDPGFIDILVDRFATEPDFNVRDMLTWALLHHDRSTVLDRVVPLVRSDIPQARSQALHTMSKMAEPETWGSITRDMLLDPDDEVAKAAWRAATAVVPAGQEGDLAATLATQFNRGDRHMRHSLSRALVSLGDAALPAIRAAQANSDEGVREHATATARMLADPDTDFDVAVAEAQRTVALLGAPLTDG